VRDDDRETYSDDHWNFLAVGSTGNGRRWIDYDTSTVRLTNNDRWVFIQLYRWFLSILQVLTIIHPETLVRMAYE
jgi:hypothetical protein